MNVPVILGKKIISNTNPIIGSIIDVVDDYNNEKNLSIMNDRINYLFSKISSIEDFYNRFKYLSSDECKYIHIRNFLKFYFIKSDPGLVDVNVKLIIDYVLDKGDYSVYDILLEKMCLLNKYSIEILGSLKNIDPEYDENYKENFYSLKSIINYFNLDNNVSLYDIMNFDESNERYNEIAYGLTCLLQNDFLVSINNSYPGKIPSNLVEQIKVTRLGELLINYI